MARTKSFRFSIDVPFEEYKENEGLFSTQQLGSIKVIGKCTLSPTQADDDFPGEDWAIIRIESLLYESIDLLPLFNFFAPIALMQFRDYANQGCKKIYIQKNKLLKNV